jgi:hypothetical protein
MSAALALIFAYSKMGGRKSSTPVILPDLKLNSDLSQSSLLSPFSPSQMNTTCIGTGMPSLTGSNSASPGMLPEGFTGCYGFTGIASPSVAAALASPSPSALVSSSWLLHGFTGIASPSGAAALASPSPSASASSSRLPADQLKELAVMVAEIIRPMVNGILYSSNLSTPIAANAFPSISRPELPPGNVGNRPNFDLSSRSNMGFTDVPPPAASRVPALEAPQPSKHRPDKKPAAAAAAATAAAAAAAPTAAAAESQLVPCKWPTSLLTDLKSSYTKYMESGFIALERE